MISLKRLKLNNIDGYLIHDAKDFYNKDIVKGLQICKEEKIIKQKELKIWFH